MLKCTEYLRKVIDSYRRDGILAGDPEFKWNDAHTPTPRCLKGETTVPLIECHHYIHDIYQSEDHGTCCFFPGIVRDYLYGDGFLCENWFELVDLCEKWQGCLAAKAGKSAFLNNKGVFDPANKSKVLEGNKQGGYKGGRLAGSLSIQNNTGLFDPLNKEQVLAGNRKGGENTKGERHGNAKAVEVTFNDGSVLVFPTVTAGATALCVSHPTLTSWIKGRSRPSPERGISDIRTLDSI